MKTTHCLAALTALAVLSGCAGLTPPSADRLAALPVVTYPDKPSAADYVYRLPAGKPIEMRIRVDGSALADGVDQTIAASLGREIYLYKEWASEDGRTWQAADKLVGVRLTVSLPSHERPGPGDMHLTVDRKTNEPLPR